MSSTLLHHLDMIFSAAKEYKIYTRYDIIDERKLDEMPKRILVLGLYGSRGGLETSVMNYYRNFDRSRVQFDFIVQDDFFYFEEEIKQLGGRVFKVAHIKKNPLRHIIEVARIIKLNGFTTVYIGMMSALNVAPIISCKLARVKCIIVHSHSTSARGVVKRWIHFINRKFISSSADYRWACSSEAGRWLFGKKEFNLVHNAINLDLFTFSEKKANKILDEFSIKGNFVIGNIARLVPEKNQKFLIDLLPSLLEKNPQTVLLLVGGGSDEQILRDHAASKNLTGKVYFAGDRNDVQDLYSAFDVFVLPSTFEGLPIVGVEAQAAGLPVFFSKNVSSEAKISRNVQFLDIDDKAETWCALILSSKRADAQKVHSEMIQAGYNIKIEASKMQNFLETT